jgi:hypothetical protein
MSVAQALIELTRLGLPGFIVATALVVINNRKELKLKDKEIQLAALQKDKDIELERVGGVNEVNLLREQREYATSLAKVKLDNEIEQKRLGLNIIEARNEAAQNLYEYSKTLTAQQDSLVKEQASTVERIGGWVEVVNSLIRPTISICILLLIISITSVYMSVAKQLSEALLQSKNYEAVFNIGKTIFDTGFFLDLRAVFTNIITFWFGERASAKLARKRSS